MLSELGTLFRKFHHTTVDPQGRVRPSLGKADLDPDDTGVAAKYDPQEAAQVFAAGLNNIPQGNGPQAPFTTGSIKKGENYTAFDGTPFTHGETDGLLHYPDEE